MDRKQKGGSLSPPAYLALFTLAFYAILFISILMG
jgi:hypothetical protein